MININENNAVIQHGCRKMPLKILKTIKPNEGTWSNKIEQILKSRNSTLENREDNAKMASNPNAINYVVEYAKEEKLCKKVILLLTK